MNVDDVDQVDERRKALERVAALDGGGRLVALIAFRACAERDYLQTAVARLEAERERLEAEAETLRRNLRDASERIAHLLAAVDRLERLDRDVDAM